LGLVEKKKRAEAVVSWPVCGSVKMALVFTVELQRLDVDLAVYATMMMIWAGLGWGGVG